MEENKAQLEELQLRLSKLEDTVSKLIRANQQIPKYVDAFKEKVYTTDEKLEELFITNDKIPEYISAFQKKIEELEKDILILKADKQLQPINDTSSLHESTILSQVTLQESQPQERLAPTQPIYMAPPFQKPAAKSSYNPAPMQKPIPKPSQEKLDTEMEVEIGSLWMNRIGIVALILSVAYFLKYSFDNNLIGPLGQVIIGFLLGFGFIGVSYLFDKKYPILSTGLIGGGSAILYFSTYASYSFYEFIGQGVAFSIFTLITIGTAYLAIKKDSLAIMHLGTIVAFLTPFILATDTPNDFGFLMYIILLNLGVLLVSVMKQWRSVFYASFFTTHLCFLAWLVNRFIYFDGSMEQIHTFLGMGSLLIIYAEFQVIALFSSRINSQNEFSDEMEIFDLILLYSNACILFFEGYYMLDKINPDVLGLFTTVCSILYWGMFDLVRHRSSSNSKTKFSLLAIAVTFLTIAVPVQFDGNIIPLAWSVQSLTFAMISLKLSIKEFEKMNLILLPLALLSIFIHMFSINFIDSTSSFFNIDSVITLVSILMVIVAGNMLRRSYQTVSNVLTIISNVLFVSFFLIEISKLMISSDAQALLTSLFLLLYAIILMGIGFHRKLRFFRITALVILGFVICKVFLFDLSSLEGLYRILSFMCLGLILIGASYLYQKFKGILLGDTQDS